MILATLTPTALKLILPPPNTVTLLLPFARVPIKLPLVVFPVTANVVNVPKLVIFGCALTDTVFAMLAVLAVPYKLPIK